VYRKIRLLVVLLAAGLAWPAGARADVRQDDPRREAEEKASSPDRLTPALEQRIEGKASLGDVQIDLFWSPRGKAKSARIFGNGVGIWRRRVQFRLSKAEVLGILRAVEKARFGSMPDQFGEDEESEKNEGPRLKGRLIVRAGQTRKTTQQLVDGEQSEALARLIEKILKICEGPAKKGIGAANMTEALEFAASGRLAPEVLEVVVQRRPDPKSKAEPPAGWTLKLAGLRASEADVAAGASAAGRSLALTEKQFRELATLLAASEPSTLPQSLYAASYTDVTITILEYSRTIVGRQFLGMTQETHGDRQKAFDRITAALERLRERVARDGKP
jgi:hypothetical protein